MKTGELISLIAATGALVTAVLYLSDDPGTPAGGSVATAGSGHKSALSPLEQIYTDYNLTVNANRGTRGVQYYPCPSGYRCRDLLLPQLHLNLDKIAWDHCRGDDESCLILITDFLILSGIDDVEPYLTARRTSSD